MRAPLPGVIFDDESRNEADVVGLLGGRLIVGEVKRGRPNLPDSSLQKTSKLPADLVPTSTSWQRQTT
jgi:hypothetical protein